MSVTLRTVAVTTAASSIARTGQALYTLVVPSDVVAGETAILTMHIAGGVVPTDPAGWTPLKAVAQGSTLQQVSWSKVLTALDAGTSHDVSFASGVRGTLTCVLAKGTDGAPVSVAAASSVTTPGGTATGVGATPTVTDSVVLEVLTVRSQTVGGVITVGSDAGYTELYDYSTVATTTVNVTSAVYSVPAATTAPIAAPTFTMAGGTMTYIATAIVIAPAAVAAVKTVFKRKPGTVEFGLYTGPASPPIRLKVIGMFDGKVIRPAHVAGYVVPSAVSTPWSGAAKYGYSLGDKSLSVATTTFGKGAVRQFGPDTPAPLSTAFYDGRDLYYSFAGQGMHGNEMVSGSFDAAMLTTLQAVPAGVNFVFTYSHEPEDNWPTTGTSGPGNTACPMFQAAQSYFIKKVRSMVANPANNIVGNIYTGIIFTAYHCDAGSPAGLDNWWPTDVEPDFFGIDIDGFTVGSATYPDPILRIKNAAAFAAKHNVEWGATEFSHYPVASDTDRSLRTKWLQDISAEVVANGGKVVCLYDQSLNGSISFTYDNEVAAWKSLVTGATVNPAATGTFMASGIDGAGFQNDASQSPFTIPSGPLAGKRPIIVVADVAGAHRTVDGGKTYTAVNGARNIAGNPVALPTHIADSYWSKSPTKAGTAYVLTDNGIYRSTDFAATFQQRAINVDAAGNGKVGALEIDGREHPRHTSGLIAENLDGTCLWIASKSGLKLSKDGGATQSGPEAFAADHVRTVVWDPNNVNKVYVGIHNDGSGDKTRNGVWQITDATTTMAAISRVGTAWPFTRGCEQLFLDDNAGTTTLYAAAHDGGVASWTSGAWVTQNNGLDNGENLAYQALNGVRTGGSLRLITGGSGFGAQSLPARKNRYIYYGTVNGATGVVTWTCASAPATVIENNYGSTEPAFVSQIGYQDFGHTNDWVSSSLFFDLDNVNRVYSAGRGGLWIGDRNPTTGAWTWTVSTKGLMVTVNMTVVTNPLVGGEAHIGSMDYTLLATDDNGLHASTSGVGGVGAPSTGDAASYDGLPIAGQPVGLLVGASVRGAPQASPDNAAYYSANPRGATPNWQKLDFGAGNVSPAIAGGIYDVVGVCLGRTAPGGTPVFMALVNQTGLYRKVGLAGTWNKMTDLPLQAGTRPIAYWAWRPNTATVFCHTGPAVYRSDDAGANWVKIYDATSTTYARYNTIEVDPIDTTKLYVSNGGDGLVRLNNATTTTSVANTTVTSMTATGVGSITIHRPTGTLFADVPASGGMLRWLTPRNSTTSTDIADQFKRDNGRSIRSIGITNDGWLLTADNGQGSMRARVVVA